MGKRLRAFIGLGTGEDGSVSQIMIEKKRLGSGRSDRCFHLRRVLWDDHDFVARLRRTMDGWDHSLYSSSAANSTIGGKVQ